MESIQTPIDGRIENNVDDPSDKMMGVTQRYLDFIHRISQGDHFSHKDAASSILIFDCQKIFNGKVYTTNRDAFIADLLEVNRAQGNWVVEPVDILVSPQSNCAVLRLMIYMENIGTFTTIVILRFNSDYLISEINEVFNKVESSYNFDGENKV